MSEPLVATYSRGGQTVKVLQEGCAVVILPDNVASDTDVKLPEQLELHAKETLACMYSSGPKGTSQVVNLVGTEHQNVFRLGQKFTEYLVELGEKAASKARSRELASTFSAIGLASSATKGIVGGMGGRLYTGRGRGTKAAGLKRTAAKGSPAGSAQKPPFQPRLVPLVSRCMSLLEAFGSILVADVSNEGRALRTRPRSYLDVKVFFGTESALSNISVAGQLVSAEAATRGGFWVMRVAQAALEVGLIPVDCSYSKRVAEVVAAQQGSLDPRIRELLVTEFHHHSQTMHEVFRMSQEDVDKFWRMLLALPILGTTSFAGDSHSATAILPLDRWKLQWAAQVLEVDATALQRSLCQRLVRAGNRASVMMVGRTAAQAHQACLGMCRSLYAACFQQILEFTNATFSRQTSSLPKHPGRVLYISVRCSPGVDLSLLQPDASGTLSDLCSMFVQLQLLCAVRHKLCARRKVSEDRSSEGEGQLNSVGSQGKVATQQFQDDCWGADPRQHAQLIDAVLRVVEDHCSLGHSNSRALHGAIVALLEAEAGVPLSPSGSKVGRTKSPRFELVHQNQEDRVQFNCEKFVTDNDQTLLAEVRDLFVVSKDSGELTTGFLQDVVQVALQRSTPDFVSAGVRKGFYLLFGHSQEVNERYVVCITLLTGHQSYSPEKGVDLPWVQDQLKCFPIESLRHAVLGDDVNDMVSLPDRSQSFGSEFEEEGVVRVDNASGDGKVFSTSTSSNSFEENMSQDCTHEDSSESESDELRSSSGSDSDGFASGFDSDDSKNTSNGSDSDGSRNMSNGSDSDGSNNMPSGSDSDGSNNMPSGSDSDDSNTSDPDDDDPDTRNPIIVNQIDNDSDGDIEPKQVKNKYAEDTNLDNSNGESLHSTDPRNATIKEPDSDSEQGEELTSTSKASSAVTLIANLARGYLARKRFSKTLSALIALQSWTRSLQQRLRFLMLRRHVMAALSLQRWFRSTTLKRQRTRLSRELSSAVAIQSWTRHVFLRRTYLAERTEYLRALIRLQAWFRSVRISRHLTSVLETNRRWSEVLLPGESVVHTGRVLKRVSRLTARSRVRQLVFTTGLLGAEGQVVRWPRLLYLGTSKRGVGRIRGEIRWDPRAISAWASSRTQFKVWSIPSGSKAKTEWTWETTDGDSAASWIQCLGHCFLPRDLLLGHPFLPTPEAPWTLAARERMALHQGQLIGLTQAPAWTASQPDHSASWSSPVWVRVLQNCTLLWYTEGNLDVPAGGVTLNGSVQRVRWLPKSQSPGGVSGCAALWLRRDSPPWVVRATGADPGPVQALVQALVEAGALARAQAERLHAGQAVADSQPPTPPQGALDAKKLVSETSGHSKSYATIQVSKKVERKPSHRRLSLPLRSPGRKEAKRGTAKCPSTLAGLEFLVSEADALFGSRDSARALSWYQEVLTVLGLGKSTVQTGTRVDAGLSEEMKTVAMHCFNRMVQCVLVQGDSDLALDLCERGLEVCASNRELMLRQAVVFKNLGAFGPCLGTLRRVLAASPARADSKPALPDPLARVALDMLAQVADLLHQCSPTTKSSTQQMIIARYSYNGREETAGIGGGREETFRSGGEREGTFRSGGERERTFRSGGEREGTFRSGGEREATFDNGGGKEEKIKVPFGLLRFNQGDQVEVLSSGNDDSWWFGRSNGKLGFFPKCYVE